MWGVRSYTADRVIGQSFRVNQARKMLNIVALGKMESDQVKWIICVHLAH